MNSLFREATDIFYILAGYADYPETFNSGQNKTGSINEVSVERLQTSVLA